MMTVGWRPCLPAFRKSQFIFANDFTDCAANTTGDPKHRRGGLRGMQVRSSADIGW